MSVVPRGAKWQVNLSYGGRRYRPEFASKVEAEAWELRARANLVLGLPIDSPSKASPGPSPSTIGGLVAYVGTTHWRKKKSAETLLRNAELFAEFCGPKASAASCLTTEKVAEYCRDLEKRGRSGATVNRHLSAISTLGKFAVHPNMRLIEARPLLSWQHEGEGRLRFLTPEEFAAIQALLFKWGRPTDATFYLFLVDTGARLSEAQKLRWEDVDIGNAPRVTFVDRKSGRTTATPLTARLRAALQRMPRDQSGPFTHVSKGSQTALWRRLQTHLPFLVDCVPHHVFRHTTASWLVQRGVDLYRVQKFMDHASILTTQRYSHLSPTHMEDAVKALEGVC